MNGLSHGDADDDFWIKVLYGLGSYILEESGNSTADEITRLFCGYWLLYTIAELNSPEK